MPPQAQGDIYSRWLGITDANRPLTNYQLLRLKNFEDDPAQVRAHYNKMSAHIRKYLTTEYAEKAHGILNELTRAMLCLTDSRRKSDYDASLGRSSKGETKKRSLEDILIKRKLIDADQLAKAQKLSAAIGVELRDALVQQKAIDSQAVAQAFAESQGLPYVDLLQVDFDLDLLGKMPAMLARQHSAVPLMIDNDRVLVAAANPLPTDLEDELRLRMGMTIRSVIATPTAVHEIVNRYFPREAAAREMGVTAPKAGGEQEELDPAVVAERKKDRLKFTGLAAALTFAGSAIAIQVAGSMSRSLSGIPLLQQYGVGFLLALVAAGITWFVKRK
ncbi:MAG TPA: hypothetical protein VHV77_07725 [Pirellulales bacterium]|jgi:hypothetical protein|nr:hypothetical protein [Pirellulales bacterium]